MNAETQLHYRYDEYLEVLERSAVKLEYDDGVIYARIGGSPGHGALSAAAIARPWSSRGT